MTGKTTTYSKLVQFSETDLVIEKVSDGSFTQPTPEKFDGAAFDAYAAATPVIKYIEYSGTLTIDGYYYNIAVEGTDLQGSLAYPADGFVDASLNGQVVIVKGYTLGMTNQSKMLSTIAVSVEKDGDAPAEPKITKLDPTSLSFAATDNAKTVTVTAANADDCTIGAVHDLRKRDGCNCDAQGKHDGAGYHRHADHQTDEGRCRCGYQDRCDFAGREIRTGR